MKKLILLVTLTLTTGLFANEKYVECSRTDLVQLNTIASQGAGNMSEAVIDLLTNEEIESCMIQRPAYYFPTVCGANTFQVILFELETTKGSYKITTRSSEQSCRPGTYKPMRVISFDASLKN